MRHAKGRYKASCGTRGFIVNLVPQDTPDITIAVERKVYEYRIMYPDLYDMWRDGSYITLNEYRD